MAAPMLKKKKELHYRRAGTSRSCRYCNHFTSFVSSSSRCKIIGIDGGRVYNISPNSICDKYDGSEYLKRLKAGTSFQDKG